MLAPPPASSASRSDSFSFTKSVSWTDSFVRRMETIVSAPKTPGKARSSSAQRRLKLVVRGAVQGVGFRPFVYRLATELELSGWVLNSAQGIFIEVEGARDSLRRFLLRLEKEKPSRAIIHSLESSFLDPVGYGAFEILNK